MSASFLPQLVGGLAIGFVYGLVALGFTILLKSLDLFYFAQGEMITVGAFLGLIIGGSLHLSYWLLIPIVTVLTALLGVAIERVLFRPLVRRSAPIGNLVMVTVGLSIVIRNTVQLFAGGDNFSFPPIYPKGRIPVLGVQLNTLHLVVVVVGLVYAGAMWFFFYRTKPGTALRASAEDLQTARLMGVRPETTYSLSFAISAGLGGTCGVLLGPLFFVGYELGIVSFKGLVGSALGGLYSLGGALAGGIGVGLVETFTAGTLSSAWKDFAAYAVLVLVLLGASLRAARLSGRGWRLW